MGTLNIPIPDDIHKIFQDKYPRKQIERILSLIKEDIGYSDDMIDMKIKNLENQISEIEKERKELMSIKEKKEKDIQKKIKKYWDQFEKEVGWSSQKEGWYPQWKGETKPHPWWEAKGIRLSYEKVMEIRRGNNVG